MEFFIWILLAFIMDIKCVLREEMLWVYVQA